MEDSILTFLVGFLAQLLFFGRMLVQWFHSEKAGESVSPSIFWKLSLLASILMFVYGILRIDFAIIFGQLLVYFIYIRNLQLKHRWKELHLALKIFVHLMPILGIAYLLSGAPNSLHDVFNNEDVPVKLLLWGSAGQVVFTSRFVYQWISSENKKESVLLPTFWIISLCGALMILSYAVIRKDPVLFCAHAFGVFIYARNLLLIANNKRALNDSKRVNQQGQTN